MEIVVEKKPRVIYAISDGFQLLEHCLAIYEWLEGGFFVTPRKQEVVPWLQKFNYGVTVKDVAQIKPYVNNLDYAIVLPSASHGYSELKGKNVFRTTHGFSEKGFYYKGVAGLENKIPLQFARWLRGTYDYTLDFHKKYLNINPEKKTILYIPTQGAFTSFSDATYNVFKQLKAKDKYNIVIKPHALCWELQKDLITKVEKDFKININLHNIMPFLELADVIVGDISAGTSAAFYYNQKPVILLKNPVSDRKSDLLMSEKNVNVLTPGQYSNIPGEIEKCLANPLEKMEERKKYFKKWYGEVNGLEGLKYSELILNRLGIKYEIKEGV